MSLDRAMLRRESYDTAQQFLRASDPSLARFPRPTKSIAFYWGLKVFELPKSIADLDHGMIIGNRIIVARQRRFWERQLTIAHELGHFALKAFNDQQEDECSAFGSALLVPFEDLDDSLRFFLGSGPYSIGTLAWSEAETGVVSRLVHHYAVGYKALLWAIGDYGLLQGVPEWHGGDAIDSLMAEYRSAWEEARKRFQTSAD